jgi:hypothetical protein
LVSSPRYCGSSFLHEAQSHAGYDRQEAIVWRGTVFTVDHDHIPDSFQVLAYVYRIEWQARGMPHAHCLFILRNKILSPRDIDSIVWAEIPCPQRFPMLHAIVCKRMIHDPCENNFDAPCMRKNGKGTCYRHFPKKLNSVTTIVGIIPIYDVVFVVMHDRRWLP